MPDEPGEYTIDVAFHLRAATALGGRRPHRGARTGCLHVVRRESAPATSRRDLVITACTTSGCAERHFTVLFSRLYGGLASYRYGDGVDGGRELLTTMPKPSFWHAPTSNERGWERPSKTASGCWRAATCGEKSTARVRSTTMR